ncbi:MAG TPA: CcdB family protein [Acetobacteraceae bacterium]|nr:CcdB family protein [Acetobacteraceae bacterium]
MARLDVYPMPGRAGRGYVLDIQADLLSGLATRAVVPLLPQSAAPPPIRDLNPVFEVGGEPHVMLTQAIASVPVRELGRPVVSLGYQHDAVIRALDVLLTGL